MYRKKITIEIQSHNGFRLDAVENGIKDIIEEQMRNYPEDWKMQVIDLNPNKEPK